MKKKELVWPLLSFTLAGLLCIAVLYAAGCEKGEKATTPSIQAQPGEFANVTCPMMNSPIKPEKVTPELTRVYKGQKVAFCCAECLPEWDKLSDEKKDAALEKSK